ncbi:MAG: Crp/Fnr family transcriptional regulator [Anaerolineae bacterium]|nr:Crp/Fnr family transcriptional regulator [Anaerolineae bacterium]
MYAHKTSPPFESNPATQAGPTGAQGHPGFAFVVGEPPTTASHELQPTVASALLRQRIALLTAQPYFAALSGADLEYLATRMTECHYHAGEMIFVEGDPCLGLYIVHQGEVRIYKLSPEGREQVLHYVKPGQSFNEVPVFDEGPTPANVVALTPCAVWIVPRSLILEFMRTRPEMAMTIIRNIGRRLRHLVGLVADLSLRTVTNRLAKLLLDTAAGDQTARVLTQQEMAAQLGTVREVVARALKQLESCGYIHIERGRIIIVNRQGLEALI